ncbi:hypothetical protein JOF46_000464 [Paeniglutamicibacter psychrophenolicus]|uniref:Uncharacterized protein n=1 Tax=Paeniglutamicibacter psychrophenolicus TaxID=257454 RepID=A0ABS4W8M7_9MICC|nr:hypothetical protein [Paeniglutamicibacter psychrophenolicus]
MHSLGLAQWWLHQRTHEEKLANEPPITIIG